MFFLFLALPILFVLAAISYLVYYFIQRKKQKSNTNETIWLESLDMNRWRGGVRRRMGLTKTKEQFYEIKKDIKFP